MIQDFSKLERHRVFCIDMRSFYASCECVVQGLDPMTAKLAVVSDPTRDGTVILAATPELKKLGIKTGSRLYEIKKLNDPFIVVAQTRMGYYYSISEKIIRIFEQFVPPNAIHVYSVDEAWLTLDGTEKLYKNMSLQEIAMMIIDEIKLQTGVPAVVGIGENKAMAKFMLDIYAKNSAIAQCTYEEVVDKLHPVEIGKMWGVGVQLKKHFNAMGIYTFGDLAHFDTKVIRKHFGVIGEKLQQYAWGIDNSPVIYDVNSPPPTAFNYRSTDDNLPIKSVGNGVTLLEDYREVKSIRVAVLDLAEEVAERLRKRKLVGRTISLQIGYSQKQNIKGFSRQITLHHYTSDPVEIADICMELFMKHAVSSPVVRTIRIAISKLKEEENQNSLFSALDLINQKYGKGTLRKAIAFTEDSIAGDRSGKINGHKK